MVVTRMTFDTGVTFKGKINFKAERGLTDEEYDQVLAIQEHPQINAVLTSKDGAVFVDTQQEEEDAAGGLPPTGGLPPADAPAKPGWEKTATVITAPTPPSKPEPEPEPERKVTTYVAQPMNLKPDALEILTAEKRKIADLEAQLAAAKAPKPEPVLTPEQLKIRELEAQLAATKAAPKTRGRPRSTPVGPPTGTATPTVTAPSNGSGEAETSAGKLSNDLDSMIDKLAPKAP
jgi:hypothetical protein